MSAEADDRALGVRAEAMHAEYDAFLRQSWAAMRAARISVGGAEQNPARQSGAHRQTSVP